MSKRRSDKKTVSLEPNFKDVLVCNNNKLKPFFEIFVEPPQNIYQENLGTIFGILEITDISEDSSYIVNYLISVIKKEYFSKVKRGSVESFEVALHKANLALAKLAEHENVSWIGKFNAVISVIEKNNIHLAQTGTAQAFLLRSEIFTNISERGEEMDVNPLKTFQDVLSGRIEEKDKLILTTDSIFEIFSPDEIKRSAIKFSKEEFLQFLNTALVNELEKAAVLVIDVEEREEMEIAPQPRKIEVANAFSQKAFERPPAPKTQEEPDKEKLIRELKEQIQKNQGEFVDKKTGHIYIKDEGTPESPKTSYLNSFREKFEKVKGFSASRPQPKISSEKSVPLSPKTKFDFEKIKKIGSTLKDWTLAFFLKTGKALAYLAIFSKNILINYIFLPLKNLVVLIFFKFKNRRTAPAAPSLVDPSSSPVRLASASKIKNLIPSFARIKDLYSSFSYQNKLYAALFLILIVVVPYVYVKLSGKNEEKKVKKIETVPEIVVPLSQDKNVIRVENTDEFFSGQDISGIININGKNFILKKNEIVALSEENKTYSLPENFQNFDLFFEMPDLNLIFLLKNKRVISFHANSRKFQDNNITIPDNGEIVAGGSFLTYGYLLDKKNNQIYRYPRAEGGFSEKTDWLKDSADLSKTKSMAINENIYVTTEEKILKFFRGKNQDFTLEETATPIKISKIYTKPESENVYILDKNSSRIIKVDKDGKIIAQYYNNKIGNALDFAVDEENNLIYVADENGVRSFSKN